MRAVIALAACLALGTAPDARAACPGEAAVDALSRSILAN